jgi:UDPglucose 6-dehydrogenase
VNAADPAVGRLPPELGYVRLGTVEEALRNAEAVVVCTEWPEFRKLPWGELLPMMKRRLVIDANRFLKNELAQVEGVEHKWVGGGTA